MCLLELYFWNIRFSLYFVLYESHLFVEMLGNEVIWTVRISYETYAIMNSSRILASCKFMMIIHDKWRQFQGMNLENPLDCKCHIDSYSLRLYCNRIKPNYILEPSSDKAPSNKRYNYLYHVLLKHDRSVDRKRRHFILVTPYKKFANQLRSTESA